MSHASYVDARTGWRTIRGATAKTRLAPTREQVQENDNLSQSLVTKVRKCLPRCIGIVVLSPIWKTKPAK